MFAFRRKKPAQADAAGERSDVVTIAIGMPMPPAERQAIVAALGPGYEVVDICAAPLDTALVVVGPCSAGAIQAVTDTFPQAGVLVVERQSAATAGPVISALRAGAVGYLVAGPEHHYLATSPAA
jgi:hypothetical protein